MIGLFLIQLDLLTWRSTRQRPDPHLSPQLITHTYCRWSYVTSISTWWKKKKSGHLGTESVCEVSCLTGSLQWITPAVKSTIPCFQFPTPLQATRTQVWVMSFVAFTQRISLIGAQNHIYSSEINPHSHHAGGGNDVTVEMIYRKQKQGVWVQRG